MLLANEDNFMPHETIIKGPLQHSLKFLNSTSKSHFIFISKINI